VRAPGWSGGTLAEIGGAFPDAVKFVKEWHKTGVMPENMPDRVAYVLSLLVSTAVASGAISYAFTGQMPQGLDFVAFRTGLKDKDGNDQRYLLPSYMKDILAYARAPKTTLLHKAHPALSLASDILNNREYYGYEIRDPHANVAVQAGQTAKYVIKAFEPFWTRGARRNTEEGAGVAGMVSPLVGVMPAPAYLNRTGIQNRISELFHLRTGEATRPYSQREADSEKRQARARSQMDIYMFKRLPEADKAALLKKMNQAELERYNHGRATVMPKAVNY